MNFINKAPNAITAFPNNILFYRGANAFAQQKDGQPNHHFDA
jgi:hypothetical protein